MGATLPEGTAVVRGTHACSVCGKLTDSEEIKSEAPLERLPPLHACCPKHARLLREAQDSKPGRSLVLLRRDDGGSLAIRVYVGTDSHRPTLDVVATNPEGDDAALRGILTPSEAKVLALALLRCAERAHGIQKNLPKA